MNMSYQKINALLLIPLFLTGFLLHAQEKTAIIPQPLNIVMGNGMFSIGNRVEVKVEGQNINAQAAYLQKAWAKRFEVQPSITSAKRAGPSSILLQIITDNTLGEEGYTLKVHKTGIIISANAPNGIFYGIQTLLQLVSVTKLEKVELPWLTIVDKPRFKWRGMLLDCSRHFYPVEFIKKFIDLMAMYKFNVLQWHLIDNPGWRLEIKKYPRLTEIGAYRVDRENEPWGERTPPKENEKATYGGYYSQEEIKDIVKYAADRAITIVPEIEMPSHVMSAIASYPYLSCSGKQIQVPSGNVWPITENYCAGNDSVFQFIEDVLSEVIDLFPSQYIHIGGDEANLSNWKVCPKCLARMKTEGLGSVEELQSYFIKRVGNFLISKGRKFIGWEEILLGGLAPDAAVMSWTGTKGGIEAAKQKHDVVMSPTEYVYFDFYQADPKNEPPAPSLDTYGLYVPLIKTYAFEPVPAELTVEEGKYVIGLQANVWTEFPATPSQVEYMTIPRIFAVSEIAWSAKKASNWDNFLFRTKKNLIILKNLGYNYCENTLTAPAILKK
jgi:hexosaminidase